MLTCNDALENIFLRSFLLSINRLNGVKNLDLNEEILYMNHALKLARMGAGYTSPNPMVGAIIVKNGRMIGEGYHEVCGGPHAEVNAIEKATEEVEGATLYVTLEPCSHYGKTPPCALKLIEKKFSRVVVAMQDPNPMVAGRGIQMLRDHGIEVEVGLLEGEAQKLNEVFIKYMTLHKPFCVLKTAMTLDGKIASVTGESQWITNETSRAYVHQLRHEMSGIMVGIGTVLKDDPSLTTRLKDKQGKDPARIVVDSRLRIPLDAKMLSLTSIAPTIIATTSLADPEKAAKLEALGAILIYTPVKEGRVDLDVLMIELAERGIDGILLEGGAQLNEAALKSGIVDKVMTFIAPKLLGGSSAPTPVGGQGIERLKDAIELEHMQVTQMAGDLLIEASVKRRF
jgi:diaminohydroxyphosphoribosylaminopyrimidine deaminase/5-amino-6-(5-phosphoribosylamino)uracil reductase